MTSTMRTLAVDDAVGQDDAGQVAPRRREGDDSPSQEEAARRLSRELFSDEALDELVARAGDGQVRLTGPGGFLPELVARVLERGMGAAPARSDLPTAARSTSPGQRHTG